LSSIRSGSGRLLVGELIWRYCTVMVPRMVPVVAVA
jgi:hypothetical protein